MSVEMDLETKPSIGKWIMAKPKSRFRRGSRSPRVVEREALALAKSLGWANPSDIFESLPVCVQREMKRRVVGEEDGGPARDPEAAG